VRLRRQIPYTRAMEILLLGEHLPAAEAERIGLIGRVVPDGTALEHARAAAERIASNAPLSVQAIKRSVMETAAMTEQEGLARELELGWPIFAPEDAQEGAKAFKEKRPPLYQGK
jgi:enoyl-CoA hydratase